MVKGLQSLQNALQDQAKSAKRKVQWKLNKRQQRKGKKDREAGSASRAERSCSSPSCSESELGLASEDSFHDGGMEADERENSLSGMGHADGLGDDSLVDGDQASGRRALWDPEIMQQHVLREGGWDKAFALYVVPGDAPGIMRCCCPRTVPLPEGLAAAGDSSEDDWETRRGVSAHPLATQWRGEGNICKTVFPGVQITKFGEQTVAIPFCTCSSLMSLQKALADNVEGLEECPADLILRAQVFACPATQICSNQWAANQVLFRVAWRIHTLMWGLVCRSAASMCSMWCRALGLFAPSGREDLALTRTKTCTSGFRKSAVQLGGSFNNEFSNSVSGRPSPSQKSYMTIPGGLL